MRNPTLLLLLALGCAHAAATPPSSAAGTLELVESEPVDTGLDRPELRDAWQVWPEMIARAMHSVDLAEFYASEQAPSRLTAVISALDAALYRGVKVRFLADAGFAKTYPDTLAYLASEGAEVRTFDARAVLGGGVLHAKYFIVDAREAYIGSQNFDWRSLEHIQELGVRVVNPEILRSLRDIFESDWIGTTLKPTAPYSFPPDLKLVASPRGHLPDETLWDLPALVRLIDSAKHSVRVQLLTYGGVRELDEALARAAARGVEVTLLVSDWELRPRNLKGLRALDARVSARIFTIPQAKAGFIPFARVAHAKYCVVDGERGWVGTGNWEPDYFEKSRNVGLMIDGGQIPAQLEAFFLRNWRSPYAAPFDRNRDYTPPRISQGADDDARTASAARRAAFGQGRHGDEARGVQAGR